MLELNCFSGTGHSWEANALHHHPRSAERKKAEGNEAYKNKEYADAARLYTQAIGEYIKISVRF